VYGARAVNGSRVCREAYASTVGNCDAGGERVTQLHLDSLLKAVQNVKAHTDAMKAESARIAKEREQQTEAAKQ
jgi:hypothetical protein